MTILRRYVLIQIPEAIITGALLWFLHIWADLPSSWAIGLFVAWAVVHVVQYPFVRAAYDSRPSNRVGAERLIGARGVTEEDLDPEGYVRTQGELWRAELGDRSQRVPAGESVQVRSVRGLTLIVEAVR